MAESKGPQDAQGQTDPKASGAAGPRRSGMARWRPYTAAIVAVGVIFAASALIGMQVRSGQTGKVTVPTGVPSEAPLAIGINPAVPVTLTVYEDLRNPQSRIFYQQYGSTLDTILNSGMARVEYRFVTSVDKQYGGDGSVMAANAAACAQDQGKDQFVSFMKELWSHQPERRHDRFASEAYLENLAKKVKHLDAATFAPCVHNKDHVGWVDASQKDYLRAGLGEVPVVQINGQTLYPLKDKISPAGLQEAVRQAAVKAQNSLAPSTSPSSSPSPSASRPASPSAAPSASASASSAPSGSPS
ncbi:DsbA family protein [Streptomyces sp. RB6PN25]|uniref:DsbA family protein n=1 Tax=Streptomyces humicola TaxID=2953240 RepID=A0ABT1PZG3_9ACTN|nr:thioredoxin domain-containing protein [Streptomyces humicola]MCQ4083068.1 DsbA family protein [Streptomyces humicola]